MRHSPTAPKAGDTQYDWVAVKKASIPVGRPSVLRHTNALSILKLLREAESCSKADLVRATGLSAPTVTNVVNDLISVDLIEPMGEGESSGGRPPDMLRFKTERGCILAVDITSIGISFLLTDLNGNKLETLKLIIEKRKATPDAVCEYIAEASTTLLRKQKKTREQLIAMVVGVPAITNVEEGSVLSSSTLTNWRSVPLRSMLHQFVHHLVIVENDMNLAALGEQYCGAAQAEHNYVFISLGANVGAGIILGGKVHHGSQWSAGEIGYLRLPSLSRKHPTVQEFGELETILTSSGFLKSWKEKSRNPGQDNEELEKEMDVLEILDLAQSGDSNAEEFVNQRAGIAVDIVINLSLVLNPNLIVLGGSIGSHPMLIHSVQRQLQGSEFAVPQVTAASLGESAVLWGGIALALEAVPSVLLPLPTS